MFSSEGEFHKTANATLEHFAEALEVADTEADLEIELQGGVLSIIMMSGRQFIVNKHAPSMQIWLSSPISGGLHFSYINSEWALADGRLLKIVLAEEIKELTDVVAVFA